MSVKMHKIHSVLFHNMNTWRLKHLIYFVLVCTKKIKWLKYIIKRSNCPLIAFLVWFSSQISCFLAWLDALFILGKHRCLLKRNVSHLGERLYFQKALMLFMMLNCFGQITLNFKTKTKQNPKATSKWTERKSPSSGEMFKTSLHLSVFFLLLLFFNASLTPLFYTVATSVT